MMEKNTYFTLEESAYHPGKFLIQLNFEAWPEMSLEEGSYAIMPCRVMGLSYPQYLRFCRDILGGEVIGKNQLYPAAYLPNSSEVRAFVKLLNAQMNLIMWDHNHPNQKEHMEYLNQKRETHYDNN